MESSEDGKAVILMPEDNSQVMKTRHVMGGVSPRHFLEIVSLWSCGKLASFNVAYTEFMSIRAARSSVSANQP